MKLEIVESDNGVTRLILAGKMDIEGAASVDKEFSDVASSRKKVVVDLADVDFLASLGMRTLVVTAKSIMRRGGRMVLISPQPSVEKALRSSGIDTIIPIASDFNSAVDLVGYADTNH
jgi:anti-anti-sigma factor